MGVIVAAPTAGSCATFPATCVAASRGHERRRGPDPARHARRRAHRGLRHHALELRGRGRRLPGAETGAGAAMAAAALVELSGGQRGHGPGRREPRPPERAGPHLRPPWPTGSRRPASAATSPAPPTPIASANIALSGFLHLIPLGRGSWDAHREVSERMARELRCTALGGLSVTPDIARHRGRTGRGLRRRFLRLVLNSPPTWRSRAEEVHGHRARFEECLRWALGRRHLDHRWGACPGSWPSRAPLAE